MTALDPFEELLEFETDCWDVHEGPKSRKPDYVSRSEMRAIRRSKNDALVAGTH
jgi:hypothetical protein